MLACHAGGPGSIPGRCTPPFARADPTGIDDSNKKLDTAQVQVRHEGSSIKRERNKKNNKERDCPQDLFSKFQGLTGTAKR